jgi:hypothetical protein
MALTLAIHGYTANEENSNLITTTITRSEGITYLLNAWFILKHKHILKVSLPSFFELVNELGATRIETYSE